MSLRRAFPPICIALGFENVETLLKHAASEVEAGEQFFEFRLDYLPDPRPVSRPFPHSSGAILSARSWPPAGVTRTTAASTEASRSSFASSTMR